MKVSEMIEYLKTLDQDAEVYCFNAEYMSSSVLDIADAKYGLKYGEVPYSYEHGVPWVGYYLET